MALSLKIKVDAKVFNSSIKKLKKQLPVRLKKGLSKSGTQIAANITGRFSAAYPSIHGSKAQGITDNVKASAPLFDGKDITMGIGNMAALDKATQVMAKGTGKVYNLWRLLELGYGMKGGFRSDPYDIFPVYPTSGQGQQYYDQYGGTRRKGVHESNPERRAKPALVFYANGRLVFASHVKHPGAKGRFFFLTMTRDWYTEDRSIAVNNLNEAVDKLLEEVNYRGAKSA